MSSSRLQARFAALKAEGRAALITYIMGFDPDRITSQTLLEGLAEAGADIIELGIPFSDPMADGPTIQAAALRALAAGGSLSATLDMVRRLREKDTTTPVVLMGYFNPIHRYGIELFCADASKAGVDGVIIVDLPPEEVEVLLPHTRQHQIDVIFLTTPTSDEARLPVILEQASGFVYHVSIAGVTGAASANLDHVRDMVEKIRHHTPLPVCVGFGIRTVEQVTELAGFADGVVVGSAIVNAAMSAPTDAERTIAALTLVRQLGKALRSQSQVIKGSAK